MNITYIKIGKLEEQYLRKVFACPVGPIQLSTRSFLGKFIVANAKKTDEKPKPDGIAVAIPFIKGMNSDRHYWYFTKEATLAIQMYIESLIDLELKSFFVEAKFLGFDIQTAIKTFIGEHAFEDSKLNFEVFRKRLTRENVQKRKMLIAFSKSYSFKSISYSA